MARDLCEETKVQKDFQELPQNQLWSEHHFFKDLWVRTHRCNGSLVLTDPVNEQSDLKVLRINNVSSACVVPNMLCHRIHKDGLLVNFVSHQEMHLISCYYLQHIRIYKRWPFVSWSFSQESSRKACYGLQHNRYQLEISLYISGKIAHLESVGRQPWRYHGVVIVIAKVICRRHELHSSLKKCCHIVILLQPVCNKASCYILIASTCTQQDISSGLSSLCLN